MSIWTFADTLPGSESTLGLRNHYCPFCRVPLELLGSEWKGFDKYDPPFAIVRVCQLCGWWNVTASLSRYTRFMGLPNEYLEYETRYAHGCLKVLDVSELDTPIQELRRYLLVKHEALGQVAPRLVESLVGDIFSNMGFKVELTSFSKDGGIDLFLLRNNQERWSGIQVKRHKDRIGAEAIRDFLGALLLAGVPEGVFVSTSGFTRDARSLTTLVDRTVIRRIDLLLH